MRVLSVNAGSSSLKVSVVDTHGDQTVFECRADWARSPTQYRLTLPGADPIPTDVDWADIRSAFQRAVADIRGADLDGIEAIAHRVVHGGTRFTKSILITDGVEAALGEVAPLAPLHNPRCLEGISAARMAFPKLPHVAAFDTAFHATLRPEAYTYPVPYEWTTRWNLRKFGFHGLSHAYCVQRAAETLKRPLTELRIVVAHLGHGASLAAVDGGISVETTMGFTPLDGVMMATRSGSVDPGLLLHVLQEHGVSTLEMDRILNRESGLLGVSGVSADMRIVQQAAASGNDLAALAIAMYAHRVCQAIGAMSASMSGLDVLVFTGGIGEHATAIREAVCAPLAFLGLNLCAVSNNDVRRDGVISTSDSGAQILVIAAKEDLMLAREAGAVLKGRT